MRRLPLVLSFALLAPSCGGECLVLVSTPNQLEFNPAITRDLSARATNVGQPDHLSDGLGNTRVLSDLYPRAASAGSMRALARSECLWLPPQDVALSWELVARGTIDGYASPLDMDPENPTLPIEIAACTGTSPDRRQFMRDSDGNEAPFDLENLNANLSAAMTACSGSSPNLRNACRTHSSNCATVSNLCPSAVQTQKSTFPICGLECLQTPAAGDTTYHLELSGLASDNNMENPSGSDSLVASHTFDTTVKQVNGTAVLARPLEKLTIAGATHDFLGWKTPIGADGWEENFSTELYIHRIRVFATGGSFEQNMDTYLTPERIGFTGAYSGECAPMADGSINLEVCSQLGSLTPTNFHLHPSVRVEWDVRFPLNSYDKDAHYYIEFVVGDAPPGNGLTAGEGDARMTPSTANFGRVDTRGTAMRKIYLENNGTGPVDVTSAAVSGPFVRASDSVDLTQPFTIDPGQSVVIDVTATGVPTGDFTGELIVNVDGEPEPLRSTFRGEGYFHATTAGSAILGVNLVLTTQSIRRRFLVMSSGYNDLRVSSLAISGPGAGQLEFAWEPYSSDSPCADPTDPVCLNRPIAPGTAATYRLDRTLSGCATDFIDAEVTVTLDECVTQPSPGGTCGPGDTWQPNVLTHSLPILIAPGYCGN